MTALEFTCDYRLRWFDFDRFGCLRPQTLLDVFQDLATIHANDLGIGYDTMAARGAFWAVTRLKYEIVKPPSYFQVVHARTWPHSPGKFSFWRDYDLLDDEGDLLVKATAEWMPLDRATRTFLKVADVYDGPDDFLDRRSFDMKPKKIRIDEARALGSYVATPRFTDIDVNGHVNNSCYPGFVLDALNPNTPLVIRSLQLDYRQELLRDVPFEVHHYVQGNTITAWADHNEGSLAFTCKIELEPNGLAN